MTPLVGAPIPVLLQRRAELQPNDAAYTFYGYEQDPDGSADHSLASLTPPRR